MISLGAASKGCEVRRHGALGLVLVRARTALVRRIVGANCCPAQSLGVFHPLDMKGKYCINK
jgi:hypothetical protein